MIYWVPFLHFYQPPTQSHAVLKKICAECYRPLVKMFLEHPGAKATVNICGVLTEMFNDHGAEDILRDMKKLGGNGQFEFVDSAKYHAILPLIPHKEIKRQVESNKQTNEYFFKETYKARGLFPPEMCYSGKIAKVVSNMGYQWVLISGIACRDKWPLDFISSVSYGSSSIQILYRDDILSNKISFHRIGVAAFIKELMWLTKGKEDAYIITAMDAETFGHHIPEWEKLFLAKVYETIDTIKDIYRDANAKEKMDAAISQNKISEDLKEALPIDVATISELFEKFSKIKTKPPRPSSWSTIKNDILKKNYYPLWNSADNPIHDLQWKHVDICFDLVGHAMKLADNEESSYFADIARTILDKVLHSCQFWWANKKRGMWSVNMINKGLMLQEETALNAYKGIESSLTSDKVKKLHYQKVVIARDITSKIRDFLFFEQ